MWASWGHKLEVVGRRTRAEVGAVIAVALAIVAVGAPVPHASAALSPQPYLDTQYNSALWSELNDSWPAGYPAGWLEPEIYDVQLAAATMPPLSSFNLGEVPLRSTGVDLGWKVVRSIDTRWIHLTSSANDFTLNIPNGAQAYGEAWVKFVVPSSGKYYSDQSPALAAYAGQTIWLFAPYNTGSGPSAAEACVYSGGTDTFGQGLFFDKTLTSSNYRFGHLVNACQMQVANCEAPWVS